MKAKGKSSRERHRERWALRAVSHPVQPLRAQKSSHAAALHWATVLRP
jgi:hypothetical protein